MLHFEGRAHWPIGISAGPSERFRHVEEKVTTADTTHLQFLASFNEELARLGCGARVVAIAGTTRDMEIVDLDGAAIGRVPTRIEPETFAAFMLVVEESFSDGLRAGGIRRGRSGATH